MTKKAVMPMSPHLAIYKMQITSGLSIMHRFTGLMLFFGLLFILWWMIYCIHRYGYNSPEPFCISSFTDEVYDDALFSFFSGLFGRVIIMLWSYCLFYHLLAGIRHLFWDAGFGFNIKHVHISGWAVLVTSVLLWALTWLYLLT